MNVQRFKLESLFDLLYPLLVDIIDSNFRRPTIPRYTEIGWRRELVYRTFMRIPLEVLADLHTAILSNDKVRIESILDTMDFLMNVCPNYKFSQRKSKQAIARLRDVFLCESPVDSPYREMMKRLAEYSPKEYGLYPSEVFSLDDIARPGQKIKADLVKGQDITDSDDILFISANPDSEWERSFENIDSILFPVGSGQTVQQVPYLGDPCTGRKGWCWQRHSTDEDETQAYQDRLLAAGFGHGKRRKVIFYEISGYYVCLGLCSLDEIDYSTAINGAIPGPRVLWTFPAFSFSTLA